MSSSPEQPPTDSSGAPESHRERPDIESDEDNSNEEKDGRLSLTKALEEALGSDSRVHIEDSDQEIQAE